MLNMLKRLLCTTLMVFRDGAIVKITGIVKHDTRGDSTKLFNKLKEKWMIIFKFSLMPETTSNSSK